MWGIGRNDEGIVDTKEGITKEHGMIALTNAIGVEEV